MYHLSPEESLLLKLSRLSPPTYQQSPGFDLERLIRLASSHETAPIVYRALEHQEEVPNSLLRKLKDMYLASAGINTRNGKEAMRIVLLLRREGIEAMPLKGPFASADILGDPALHPSSDIDLLVRPDDIEKAASVLLGDGYEAMDRSKADMLGSHYHLAFTRPPYYVELHWNLVKRYYHMPPEFWWEERTSATFEGIEHITLSPERYFMALSFRAFSHEFEKLKFLVLPAELINRGALDFDKLHMLARAYGMRRLISFILRPARRGLCLCAFSCR